MWPFDRKKNTQDNDRKEQYKIEQPAVAAGIQWQQILREGKSVEIFDGCRVKCDGGFEDL